MSRAFSASEICLPESLGRCRELTWLNLAKNQLATLPESLRDLTNLQRLFLSGNDALGLPEEVLAKSNFPLEILDYYFKTRRQARPLSKPNSKAASSSKSCTCSQLVAPARQAARAGRRGGV